MKNIKTIAIALLVAFGTTASIAQTKTVDTGKSVITWVGKKVTGQHDGTVKLQSGNLVFKGKTLTGGTFVVDMNSIEVTDIKAGQGKEKLEGHLKNDDFFGTDKYPTAKLQFKKIVKKSANLYNVTADMTIKGITSPVNFDLNVNNNTATADLKVDRTKFDIKYKSASIFSGLGDASISDEFDLKAVLVF